MPFTTVRWSFHCLPRLPFSGKSGAIRSQGPSVSSPRLTTTLRTPFAAATPLDEEVVAEQFLFIRHALARFRHLVVRYERLAGLHLALLNLACVLVCFRRLHNTERSASS